MQILKKSLIVFAGLLMLVALLQPVPVSAQAVFKGAKDDACKGANLGEKTASGEDVKCTDAGGKLSVVLKNVINVLSIIVGIVAVIMIIVGGLRYVTSAGDSGRVSSAKDTIIFAIVGLIFVALAQVIVRFVLKTATDGAVPAEAEES